MDIDKPHMVVAIDFGTTYSSWACSTTHEHAENPTKMYVREWIGGEHLSQKVPTTVLIRPDGETLEAFGFAAEDRYAQFVEEGQHKLWYYFKRFKMNIFDNCELSRHTMLEDITGKILPAMTVFSRAIEFMRNDFLTHYKSKLEGRIEDQKICWVLTVPAIWNEPAKQFMRQAAVNAGIRNECLRIALEPEAASLLCNYLPLKMFTISGSQSKFQTFQKGSKYILLDAGGGTVDITVHEVVGGGKLKELHKATGGAWGGIAVDEAFKQFIKKLVGEPIFQKFSRENTIDLLDLLRGFEVKKREMQLMKESITTFRIPVSLIKLYEKETGKGLKESIGKSEYSDKLKLLNDRLKVDSAIIRGFFTKSIQNITTFVNTLLKSKQLEGVNSIIMVGGFSECQMLQESIVSSSPKLSTIVPQDAGLVVLKGAVIYGHNQDAIVERVCRYTYGIAGAMSFVQGVHKEEYRVETDVGPLCDKIFIKVVEVGESVKLHERRGGKYFKLNMENQDTYSFPIYVSSEASPTYITDDGCRMLGCVTIADLDRSVPLKDRKVEMSIIFGGTEMEVEATEFHTGKKSTVVVDFLQ